MRMLFVLSIGMAAILCDLYERKIPNPLIVAGLILGAAWQWSAKGPPGIADFLAGAGAPLLALGMLHYFRMLGAGDIKLLMVSGGFLSFWGSLKCIGLSFLIAAVFSVAVLFKHRILMRRLNYFVQYLHSYRETKIWTPYINRAEDAAYLHFSIPVVLGSICVIGGFI